MIQFAHHRFLCYGALAVALLSSGVNVVRADPPPEQVEFVPAEPDEPLAPEFSLKLAAQSLDSTALEWQKENKCCQCHANFMYLIARPVLADVLPPPPDVRDLFEYLVGEKWEKQGLRYPSEAMVVSVPLAFHDRQTTGRLHPLTRKGLERMLTHQRPDGGWNGIGGSERTFIRELEETIFAGLGIVTAPDDFAKSDNAVKGLDGVRTYLKKYSPAYPYEKGMLVWAAARIGRLWDRTEQQKWAEELLALQRADGGWTLDSLLESEPTWERGTFADKKPSDGYGTGFAIFIARQAEISADDARLQKGIAWLKKQQRASGRWFTPTSSRRTLNLPSNSGTGYAILALEACGEIPARKEK
jgi:squalene-hopene/tetraprenyl-beta-curcumene cyclase